MRTSQCLWARIITAMSEEKYEVTLPRDLADAMSGFMEHRRKELDDVEAAFVSGSLEELRGLALQMKEHGTQYGLERMAELGTELREAADRGDYDGAAAYI